MTPPKRARIGEHYLDSGPLLCLGGSPVLAELFDHHLLPKAKVVSAVVDEINRNANLILPPVGPHRKRMVKKAARAVRGRYKALLADAKATPTPEPPLLATMRSELRIRCEAKLQPGETLHQSKNEGEAECVFWAADESLEIISNDGDAHWLSDMHKVTSSTFVEAARHLVRAQKVVKRREVYRELATLSSQHIFPGEHITGELDLV